MNGTCRFHASLVDEQVLSHIRENDIADLARRTALLQRDNGTPEQRSIGFLGKPARRNIHGLIADHERVQIRFEFLVDVPDSIPPRPRPQPVPHRDEIVHSDDIGLILVFRNGDRRTAVQNASGSPSPVPNRIEVVDLEPEFFRKRLANDRFECRCILQKFVVA